MSCEHPGKHQVNVKSQIELDIGWRETCPSLIWWQTCNQKTLKMAPEILETSKDLADWVRLIFLFLIISSKIKSGRFKSSDKSILSVCSFGNLLFPISWRDFSPGNSDGIVLRIIWSEEVSIQLFFRHKPIAGPKTNPNSFWISDTV